MAECFWENRPFKSIPLERQKLDTDDTKITDLFKKNLVFSHWYLFFGLSNGMDIKNVFLPLGYSNRWMYDLHDNPCMA